MGIFGTKQRTSGVSVDDILKSKGARGAIAPRQHLQVLRSLSRLVQREKVNATAVIAGEPLNKAPHNKIFEGVRVRYAPSVDIIHKELLKSVKQAGSACVLVTADVELEKKMIRKRLDTLRLSTFRKLIDDGHDSGSQNDNGGRDRNNNGRNNNSKNKNNRRDRGPRPERKKQRPQNSEKPPKQDEISQMIDLVD